MFRRHQKLILDYPNTNKIECGFEYHRREIVIHTTRDLVTHPLTISDFFRRPLLVRGRYLITGWDLRKAEWRRFYLSNSAQFRKESDLKIGVYDEFGQRPKKILEQTFGNTFEDRIALSRVARDAVQSDYYGLLIGIFSDDLSVVS